MPLRVKCRCGQELVLRFNEWIHALFGLLVVSIIVNGTALAYIAIKLDSQKGPAEPFGPVETIGGTGGLVTASPAIGTADASPSIPPIAPPPAGVVPSGNGALDPEARKVQALAPAGEKLSPPVPHPSPARELKTSDAGLRPAIGPALADGKSARAAEAKPEAAPRVEAVKRPRQDLLPQCLLPAGTIPLERLLVVEKCEDLRLLLAFLSDGDECVRRAALKKCLSAPPTPGPPPQRDLLQVALPAAPWLLRHGGGALLTRLAGGDHGPEPRSWWDWGRGELGFEEAKGVPGEVWLPLATKAQVLKDTSAAAQAIEKSWKRKDGKPAPGTDVLLAIDATESMEEPLSALSKAGWIFAALGWSIPELRMGLLWYDDEVKGALGLGTDPRDLAQGISGIKAEGGGDVPEGVYESLKAALQLGRFDWRPDAAKHIFFIGDGPPRRVEVPGLLSLAKECHQDGGYRIHAISVNPSEGRTATLHFPELAAAGGGTAVTAASNQIAGEIFLALFPSEARAELSRLVPIEIPSPEGDAGGPAPASPAPWK